MQFLGPIGQVTYTVHFASMMREDSRVAGM